MKATVKKAYTDRLLKTVHLPGDEVDLSGERLAELVAKGFVAEGAAAPAAEVVPERTADGPAASRADAAESAPERAADRLPTADIELMTVQELVSYIGRMGGSAPSKAKKAELVEIAKGL